MAYARVQRCYSTAVYRTWYDVHSCTYTVTSNELLLCVFGLPTKPATKKHARRNPFAKYYWMTTQSLAGVW